MATKEEWKDYFELTHKRTPTLEEYSEALKNNEFQNEETVEEVFSSPVEISPQKVRRFFSNKLVIISSSLVVLLIIAFFIVELVFFYKPSPKEELKSFGNSKTSQTSEIKPSESQIKSSSSTVSSSWQTLNKEQKLPYFAAWIQNSQGKYVVFDGNENITYIVNMGTNGVQSLDDIVKVSQNAVRIIKENNNYSLQVVNMSQVNSGMSWSELTWETKETMSDSAIYNRFKDSLEPNQISEIKSESEPQITKTNVVPASFKMDIGGGAGGVELGSRFVNTDGTSNSVTLDVLNTSKNQISYKLHWFEKSNEALEYTIPPETGDLSLGYRGFPTSGADGKGNKFVFSQQDMGHFQVQFTGPLGDNIASVSSTDNHGWKIDFTDGMQVNGSVTKIPDSPHSSGTFTVSQGQGKTTEEEIGITNCIAYIFFNGSV
ncbi:hypothetical protein P9166_08990 [Lactococcus lactis]|nr:hypothetical protein P9166_08990 [Lactococcus lactis]